MKLFVYGTLKRDRGNHYKMKSAEFLGEAYIQGYQLHQCPAITPKEGGLVYGEVYEIDEALLKSLDSFEGHNEQSPHHSLYRRTPMMSYAKNTNGYWDPWFEVGVYVYNRPLNVPINESGVY